MICVPTFRLATSADIPALHALVESAYRGDSARRGWTHEADLLDGQRTDPQALATMLAAPGEVILLAEIDGALAGCIHLKPAATPATVLLGLFAVAPERQGSGLGKALLATAEAHAAAQMGAHRIDMTVIRQRGDLIAWYQRRGYAPTGDAQPFPMDDPRFGLPRRDDLAFVILFKPLQPRD